MKSKTLFEHVSGSKFLDFIRKPENKENKLDFGKMMVTFSNLIIPDIPKIAEEIKREDINVSQ